jgi:hypothetical protein
MSANGVYGRIVWLSAFLILMVKLFLSWHTYGTNDITSWFDYARYVSTEDMFSIYESIPAYNHPPLMSLWLKLLMWVTGGDPKYFPQIFRIAPIVADLGSAIVVWKVTCAFFPVEGAFLRTMVVVTSPILIMVSGFHGNTDPIFGFLILLAGYLLAVKRQLVASALVLALAVNVKIVPILVLPAFFFWIRSSRERVRFMLWFGGTALLGYLAHLVTVPRVIVRNIFSYAGIGKIWGFGALLHGMENYRGLGILLLAVAVLCFAFWLGRQSRSRERIEALPVEDGWNLFRAMALAYVSFLAFTSGFGVQYLSWLAALVVFLDISLAVLYTLSASTFLFMAYTHWCGGFPWGYANSWEAGAWPQAVATMGYVTWACTLVLLVQGILALRRAKNPVA